MRCEICGKTAPLPPDGDGVTLWRVNEKGIPGVWRCELHLTFDQDAARDLETIKLTKTISRGQ
jgi:hypothetical protein